MIIQRIVVADDEAIQRNMLSRILQKIVPEAEIIACANGKEAFEAAEKKYTDLLLTDISMPIMDGIELVEKMAETYPSVRIVLISAYQEFEYARKAIRYGVKEYLIKPFRVEDARKMIERIELELEREFEQNQRLDQYDIMLEHSRKKEYVKNLYRLLTGELRADQLQDQAYETLRGRGCVALIRWKVLVPLSKKRMGIREQQQEQLVESLKANFLEARFVMLETGLDKLERKMALLIPEKTAGKVAADLRVLLRNLAHENILFWGGVSESCQTLLEDAAELLAQAEEALALYFYTPLKGEIFEYSIHNSGMERPMISISPYEKKLRELICRGERNQVEELLEKLRTALLQESHPYPGKVKHRISAMVVSIIRELEGMVSQAEYDSFLNEAYQQFGECDSIDQLFVISEEILLRVAAYFVKSAEAFDIMESIITYIKGHLEEDISVQSLADQFHFHPNYLSAQIKGRTGESCANYILSLRMEEARRMLVETSLRVVEIAGKCGFKDSSYFNRVFKRKYVLSPEQYRKVHKKC